MLSLGLKGKPDSSRIMLIMTGKVLKDSDLLVDSGFDFSDGNVAVVHAVVNRQGTTLQKSQVCSDRSLDVPSRSELTKPSIPTHTPSTTQQTQHNNCQSNVVGHGESIIRVEIDLGEEDESEDEDAFEMLVGISTRTEEILTAANARLGDLKTGSMVSVLEFGGRALAPSDSLQEIMRSVPKLALFP